MYTESQFKWEGKFGTALVGDIYHDFFPYIVIDGVTFRYDRKTTDDDHWVTEIFYKAEDGREIVALQGTGKQLTTS